MHARSQYGNSWLKQYSEQSRQNIPPSAAGHTLLRSLDGTSPPADYGQEKGRNLTAYKGLIFKHVLCETAKEKELESCEREDGKFTHVEIKQYTLEQSLDWKNKS